MPTAKLLNLRKFLVRDQEVGGSNPLAPTTLFLITYILSPSEKVVVAITATKSAGSSPELASRKAFEESLSCRSNELPILQSVAILNASPEAGGLATLWSHRA